VPFRRNADVVVVFAIAVSVLAPAAGVRAQTASAATLKAAFVYHFAKFTEWPAAALPPGAPIVLCVLDAAQVARALEDAATGRTGDGRAFVVRRVELDGPIRACHLLYGDRLDARTSGALIHKLDGAPVLTLSDYPGFTQLGGVAHLYLEDGRMRFAVNVDAAARRGLKLSSRLLSLASIVKDDPNATPR
jgi:hypothetical protein